MFDFLREKEGKILLLLLALQLLAHLYIGLNWVYQDEENYLTEAWLFSLGRIPHLDYFSGRPPLFSLYIAPILLLSNNSMLAARLGVSIFSLGTTVLVYLLARRLFGNQAGILSSAIFAISSFGYLSFMVLQDPLIAFFVVLAFLIFASNEKGEITKTVACGLALGLQLAIRQNGAFSIVIMALLLAYTYSRDWKFALKHIAALALSSVLPLLAILAFYLALGGLTQFLFNISLMSGGVLFYISGSLLQYPVLVPLIALREFQLFALLIGPWELLKASDPGRKKALLIAVALSLCGLSALFPYPVPHHTLLVLPGLALIVSPFLLKINEKANLQNTVLFGFVFLLLLFLCAKSSWMVFLGSQETHPFIESNPYSKAANYISAHTEPGEKILAYPFVSIYYRTNRLPGSYYQIIEEDMANPEVEARIIKEMKEKPTRYFLYLSPTARGQEFFYKNLSNYVHSKYYVEDAIAGDLDTLFIYRLKNETVNQ